MMNAKELIAAATARTNRDAAMRSARTWATNTNEYTERKLCVKYARESIKRARKDNRKVVALKQAGSARPMTVVLIAVMPLIDTFSNSAMKDANKFVAHVRTRIENAGSVELAYPVRELDRNQQWDRKLRAQRDAEASMQSLAKKLTTPDGAGRFVADEIEDARHQFIAYAFKLDSKVGAVTAAELETVRGVWGESYMHVTYPNGDRDTWKTQTIVNRSVLGKRFLQFPTRLMKVQK